MIFNWKKRGTSEQFIQGGRVCVDGQKIRLVWYIDTDAGVVKTYDVIGDGKIHATSDMYQTLKHDPDCELTIGGVASRTLRGKVEITLPDGRALSESEVCA